VSRLPTAHPDQDPVLKDTYEQITRTRGYVSNILASMSNAPEGLKRFAAFGEYVRYEVKIPGRTRELVILAIARGIEYGWIHHYPHARKAGVTEEELHQLKIGTLASTLRPDERAAIVYAQEFAQGGNVADETFAALKQHFTPRQITDITLVCAYFIGLGSIMNAFRVELESDSQLAKRIERAD
jgi:alkylhydroperoxidase family enzyme